MKKRVLLLTVTILLPLLISPLLVCPIRASLGIPHLQIDSPNYYSYQDTTITIKLEIGLLHTNGPQTNPFILAHGQTQVSDHIPFDPIQYSPTISRVFYSLDEMDNMTLPLPSTGSPIFISFTQFGICLYIYQTLYNVSNGEHTLKAYALETNGEYLTDQCTFTVNTNITPSVSIISPLNQTYNKDEVPFTCVINGKFDLIGYRIDFQPLCSLKGNTTFSNLTDGLHNLTVFWGNGGKTVHFSINTTANPSTSNNQTSFNLTNITITASALAVIIISIVVIFQRGRYLARKIPSVKA
jgi:hypothetical protein